MITVLDYKAGNLRSVERALAALGLSYCVARTPEDLLMADRLIFPGVGHAKSAMDYLRSSGLAEALVGFASSGRPFLGICLGSQIILEESHEGPSTCLGILPGQVAYFPHLTGQVDQGPSSNPGMPSAIGGFFVGGERFKVPHMGWNKVSPSMENPIARHLFKGIDPQASYYFVHSYYTQPSGDTQTLCTTEYGLPFSSGLGRDNVASFQFHPEKSGKPGLAILSNFATWRP